MIKSEVIKVLLEVAERAGNETTATHPEDIAYAMSFALEAGGATLAVLSKRS